MIRFWLDDSFPNRQRRMLLSILEALSDATCLDFAEAPRREEDESGLSRQLIFQYRYE